MKTGSVEVAAWPTEAVSVDTAVAASTADNSREVRMCFIKPLSRFLCSSDVLLFAVDPATAASA